MMGFDICCGNKPGHLLRIAGRNRSENNAQ